MLEPAIRNVLTSLSTATIADAMYSLELPETQLDFGIRPLVPFTKMAGEAVTVRIEVAHGLDASDFTELTAAYESQTAGSYALIVIQVDPELHQYGILGDGAAMLALCHGFVGALVDGAIRDTHELREMGMPVFHRCIGPASIERRPAVAVGRGEPVTVGGRKIQNGDVVVGDNDGVMIIPSQNLSEVIKCSLDIMDWEGRSQTMKLMGKSRAEYLKIIGPKPHVFKK